MVWINRAPMSMRLNKKIGDIHYEITRVYNKNISEKSFCVETESSRLGKRLETCYLNIHELLVRFPDLDVWESLLYAYRKLGYSEQEQIILKADIESLRKELNMYKSLVSQVNKTIKSFEEKE